MLKHVEIYLQEQIELMKQWQETSDRPQYYEGAEKAFSNTLELIKALEPIEELKNNL